MGPAEWLGAASLAVALLAFLVAGIAAANQLASHKRPLLSVDIFSLERVAEVAPSGEGIMLDTVVSALIITVTNRGHEPMLNPRVYDSTPGYLVFERSNHTYSMPYEMQRGESVEMVTSYSLANDYDRVISVVWEEPALFKRTSETIGVRFYESAQKDLAFDVTPTEYWKRVGPFGKKGWQRPGRPWSIWRPVWGTSPDPGHGHRWSNTYAYEDSDIFREERFLTKSLTGSDMVGGKVQRREAFAEMRTRGELLPKDTPQRS